MRVQSFFLSALLALLFYGTVTRAQSDKDEQRQYFIDYNYAMALAIKAEKILKLGDFKAADSVIRISIKRYPTKEAIEYARCLGELSDVLGANLIMDLVIDRVRSSEKGYEKDLMGAVMYQIDTDLKKFKYIPYNRDRALLNFIYEAYKVNVMFGQRKWMIHSLQQMKEPVLKSHGNPKYVDYELETQRQDLIHLEKLLGNYDKAYEMASVRPLGLTYSEEDRKAEMRDVLLTKYYNLESSEGLKAALELLPESQNYESYFEIYAMLGDNQRALLYYVKLSPAQKSSPTVPYYLALMDINSEHYSDAIEKIRAIQRANKLLTIDQYYLTVSQRYLNTALGDAYSGLNQFEKAKESYELALMYNPEHKPAARGLERLSVHFKGELAADRLPPEIRLEEPIVSQGAKITVSGSGVWLKGKAVDAYGLKEVSVNGIKIYSQQSGEFWAEVPLSSTDKEIKIVATDLAGNRSSISYPILRSTGDLSPAIVPVESRQGQNYCLLIAAQNYSDKSIPSLDHPVADAIRLKMILRAFYGFAAGQVISLFNPGKDELRGKLMELRNEIRPEDNLVIFYAGHGIWAEQEKKGYWLMTDAVFQDRKTWIDNKEILELISRLPSKHTLLITDACFSGSVFKSRGIPKQMPGTIKELDGKISRVAITSGNDSEVPDESVFMKYLIKALRENKEPYLTAQKMFINQIMEAVMSETNTEPRYGTLEMAGHVGGDFIFYRK